MVQRGVCWVLTFALLTIFSKSAGMNTPFGQPLPFDPYKVLGLPRRKCTKEDVRAAFIKAARRAHPDKNPYQDPAVSHNGAYHFLNGFGRRRLASDWGLAIPQIFGANQSFAEFRKVREAYDSLMAEGKPFDPAYHFATDREMHPYPTKLRKMRREDARTELHTGPQLYEVLTLEEMDIEFHDFEDPDDGVEPIFFYTCHCSGRFELEWEETFGKGGLKRLHCDTCSLWIGVCLPDTRNAIDAASGDEEIDGSCER